MDNKKQTYLRIFFHNIMMEQELYDSMKQLIMNMKEVENIEPMPGSMNVYTNTKNEYYSILDRISNIIVQFTICNRKRIEDILCYYINNDKELSKYVSISDIDEIFMNNFMNKFLIHLFMFDNYYKIKFD